MCYDNPHQTPIELLENRHNKEPEIHKYNMEAQTSSMCLIKNKDIAYSENPKQVERNPEPCINNPHSPAHTLAEGLFSFGSSEKDSEQESFTDEFENSRKVGKTLPHKKRISRKLKQVRKFINH